MRQPTLLKVIKLDPNASLPTVGNIGEDHGYDLYANEDTTIMPGEIKPIKTGISIEFEPKAGARIGTRSSTAKKGIITVGGEIDSGYRGEVVVMLANINAPVLALKAKDTAAGRMLSLVNDSEPHIVRKGDKIAQLVKEENVILEEPKEVKKLSATKRGGKGFGSTGK